MICFLIRHGKDDDSVRGGWSDSLLTAEGVKQVERLSAEIRSANIDISMIYSSDLHDDDRPYFMKVNDVGDQILQIPVQWANFDLPYFAFNYRPAFPAGQGRVANYSNVLSNWKDEFTGHYNHGLCYTLQLDPQSTGSPGRYAMLKEFLQYVAAHDGVWFATGSELVDYCLQDKDSYPSLRELADKSAVE